MLDANLRGCRRIASLVAAARSVRRRDTGQIAEDAVAAGGEELVDVDPVRAIRLSREQLRRTMRASFAQQAVLWRDDPVELERPVEELVDSFWTTERPYCPGLCPGKPLTASAATTRTPTSAPTRRRRGRRAAAPQDGESQQPGARLQRYCIAVADVGECLPRLGDDDGRDELGRDPCERSRHDARSTSGSRTMTSST